MIIIGQNYSDLLSLPLKSHGFEVKLLPENPNVDCRLSNHADLSVFYDGAGEIWVAEYLKDSVFTRELFMEGYSVHYCSKLQGCRYPADVPLNVRLVGSSFLYNPKTADKELTVHLSCDLGKKPIPVKQGYTACSTLAVSENAMITSDHGIYAAGLANGYDVLLISSGGFSLPGYDYGFIGGCAFSAGDGRVFFTGMLHDHPDQGLIIGFLKKHNMKAVFLTGLTAFDIGGAILI